MGCSRRGRARRGLGLLRWRCDLGRGDLVDDALIGRRTGMGKVTARVLAGRKADEDLAGTVINQILDLEAQGVLLPHGWRDKRPMTLRYLNTMLSLSNSLSAARR